jgi:RNA polymerase sigma factor (sigma-70 family)
MGREANGKWCGISLHPAAGKAALGVTTLRTVVHVVDDDASFRNAIGRILRASGYEVAVYESANELLDRLPDEVQPSCLLLDVQIPGLTGPELQNRLAKQGSTVPIVFLTGHGDIPTSVRAIKAGAEDFLTKPVAKDKLLDAIERAIARYQATREQHERLKALRALLATLTQREREVFDLVVRGKMNKQIAYELGTTERTVKAHRQKVMEKTRVQSLAELVSIAERLNIRAAPANVNGT